MGEDFDYYEEYTEEERSFLRTLKKFKDKCLGIVEKMIKRSTE